MKHTPKPKQPSSQVAMHLPIDLVERARNLCYWERITIKDLLTKALDKEIRGYERRKCGGQPYKQREGGLRRGNAS